MATKLKVWQLIARLRTMPENADAIVEIPDAGDGDMYHDVYAVQDDEDGEVCLVCYAPQPKTIEGDKTGWPERPKYEPAKPAPKLVKVNFGAVRPPVGVEMELDLGHGNKVRGKIVGFDQFGNADFAVSGPVKEPEPKPRNYTSADFGRRPVVGFDFEAGGFGFNKETPFGRKK